MDFGVSKGSGDMPSEIIAIIEQVFGESTELRQNLLGQLLGIITGKGVHEYKMGESSPGHYDWVDTGDEERDPITGDIIKPGGTQKVWVPGEKGKMEWVPTGEGGVQLPMIAQAQEQQRRATSQAMTQTEGQLAQRGMVGTPFGENILATMGQQGRQAVAGVEQNFLQQFLQMIPGMITGNIQSIMGALPGTRKTDQFGLNFGIGG